MSKNISANLFLNLMEMIAENFTLNSESQFKNLQLGVQLFTKFVFLQDTLIDEDVIWVEQYEKKENILYDINSSYRDAFYYLNQVFDQKHPFWNYLFDEEKNYYDFIIKEKYLNTTKSEITLADFEEMTYAKHALALVPIKGMEWLFEAKVSYEAIEKIFVPIFNGMQMMDDIDDFYKDFSVGTWNFLQYEVQKIIRDENLVDDGTLTKFQERVFYASGICKTNTAYVLHEYLKAKQFANTHQFSEIEKWIDLMIIEIKESIAFVDKVSN